MAKSETGEQVHQSKTFSFDLLGLAQRRPGLGEVIMQAHQGELGQSRYGAVLHQSEERQVSLGRFLDSPLLQTTGATLGEKKGTGGPFPSRGQAGEDPRL